MKLHVSAYNGHLQVSIPNKGSLYIRVGGVDVEISMHQFPVALLSRANSYVQFNTLRTGAFKLFKCTFPGSKQFKSTFILCFFKNF